MHAFGGCAGSADWAERWAELETPRTKHCFCVDISGVQNTTLDKAFSASSTSRVPPLGREQPPRRGIFPPCTKYCDPAFNPIPSSLERFYLCQQTLVADVSRPAESHGLVCLRRSLPPALPSMFVEGFHLIKSRASHPCHTSRPAQPQGAASETLSPQDDNRLQEARFVFSIIS